MSPSAAPVSLSRPARRILAILAVALLAVLGFAVPASAHDTLVSTDPGDGTELETSPEDVTLTFSDDVMTVAPVVRVLDAEGTVVLDEAPTIEGTDATITLTEPLDAGEYTVQWRVVSSDGHPIEGDFSFAVQEDSATAEDPSASDGTVAETSVAAPSDAEADVETSSSPQAEETEEGGAGALLPVFIGLGVIAVIAVVIALRSGRGSRS